MKTINVPSASVDISELLNQAREDDILVRLADGSEFLLIAVDEFDQEVAKSRNNPRLMALLESRGSQAATISLDDAKRRLQL
jgi:hypothetical protein